MWNVDRKNCTRFIPATTLYYENINRLKRSNCSLSTSPQLLLIIRLCFTLHFDPIENYLGVNAAAAIDCIALLDWLWAVRLWSPFRLPTCYPLVGLSVWLAHNFLYTIQFAGALCGVLYRLCPAYTIHRWTMCPSAAVRCEMFRK